MWYLRWVGWGVVLANLSACGSLQKTPDDAASESIAIAPLSVQLCPRIKVSNAPNLKRASTGCVHGIKLLVAPAPKACLSSGFGKRLTRRHTGIDYQSKPAGAVIAAGNGTIVEIGFRKKDFGNWMIIDHGEGVYTSYAHLARFNKSIHRGSKIVRGQKLGIMGSSGNITDAIHLHYEMREGDYNKERNWWLLDPVDPFSLPNRCS